MVIRANRLGIQAAFFILRWLLNATIFIRRYAIKVCGKVCGKVRRKVRRKVTGIGDR